MRGARLEPNVISLQRWNQRVREGRAVAAGSGGAQRDADGEAAAQPLVSYTAGISACAKGVQWQRALALLSEMWEAKLERNRQLQRWDQRVREGRAVAAGAGLALRDVGGEAAAQRVSYSAGISACEKGDQWQRALALLSEMWDARLEPSLLQRWDQRVREGRAVAGGSGAAQRDVGGDAGARCHRYSAGISACEKAEKWQRALVLLSKMWEVRLEPNVISLRRRDQRLREGQAVAAGSGAAHRCAGGEARAQLSYSAGISACEKGNQWQRALALLNEAREAKLELAVISYNAGVRACERGGQWQRALALLGEMQEAKHDPDSISYTAGVSACEFGEQWLRASALLSEMWEMTFDQLQRRS
ncbi:unnamed protein product [Prorocentrum cordatum]|uniref:Pentatricopeptide repeat-containing protein, chloroplastic n=1 Tax=Prorocentrum cordatum TaxID=2364126 RepID=A0ABN9W2E3_9DINO|nr:unnamed protein product [Polarella glacialis]